MKFDEFGFPLEQEDQSTSKVDELGFPLDTAPQTGLDIGGRGTRIFIIIFGIDALNSKINLK